nr:MAG TPA: hypothetical protein [Caudoviricetes sp.]
MELEVQFHFDQNKGWPLLIEIVQVRPYLVFRLRYHLYQNELDLLQLQ